MNLFLSQSQSPMQPRPYQAEAIDALDQHIRTKDNNPCVVLPTAAGKSPVMAWAIQRWKTEYPPLRVIVLAHVKELVEQNAAKMAAIWPGADIGIYAAGLNARDMHASITFASIDSVYNKAGEFEPFDLILVDEAHRIPARGEGKYRKFIDTARICNRNVRVVGFTATPYRLTSGPICHRDHILNEICYEAKIRPLIEQGYLCPLRSKVAQNQPDLSKVEKRGGEYVAKSLAQAVDREALVDEAVREAVRILDAENRQAAIFFCVDVQHTQHVSQALRRHGWHAPAVTGKTPKAQRDRIAQQFTNGQIRGLVNVNVFTEGFDATRTDAVVLLRPTQSMGLYTQMVGRGLRLNPCKQDCLVLDFAHCIDQHGPIDLLEAGEVRVRACQRCQEVFSQAINKCPKCGWVVPPRTIEAERQAAAEKERQMHATRPASRAILSGEPETFSVDAAEVNRHRKPGAPDSLRVTYRCGLSQFREWVCLDHEGYAKRKAEHWWIRRFGKPVPSVDEALGDMFLGNKIAEVTESITVRQVGKYPEIINAKIKQQEYAG